MVIGMDYMYLLWMDHEQVVTDLAIMQILEMLQYYMYTCKKDPDRTSQTGSFLFSGMIFIKSYLIFSLSTHPKGENPSYAKHLAQTTTTFLSSPFLIQSEKRASFLFCRRKPKRESRTDVSQKLSTLLT